MSNITTSRITSAMIPGIRKAIEICESYADENMAISHDNILHACTTKDDVKVEDIDQSVIHTSKYHAAKEIVSLLRWTIGKGAVA